MPDSLCTFQPIGAGSPINLGNQDCWVEVESDQAVETYTVHAYYLRNEEADPKDGTTPAAVRAAAEVYFKNLVQSLGITKADTEDVGGTEYLVPRIGAVSGTLINPYTSLSVSGLYFVDADFDDDGWRGYEIELTFVKQRTLAAPQTATFDPDGATPVTAIGTGTSYIVKTRDAKVETWTVFSSFTAVNRFSAETYAASLAALFNPMPLESINTPTGAQFVPNAQATKGTLANPKTSLSEANVYCVSIEHDDRGLLTYGLTLVFQRSLYATVTDPATDNRVAKYKSVPIGNRPARILVSAEELAYYRVVVSAEYEAADAAIYADALATALGFEPVFTDPLPRGNAGSRASFRSFSAVTGALSCPAILASPITDLYITGLRVSESGVNRVSVEVTLMKSR